MAGHRRRRKPRPGRRHTFTLIAAAAATTSLPANIVHAETSLTGSSIVLKSNSSTTLSSNGYLGTYLNIPAGGATINLTVNATRGSTGSGEPHMNIVIADTLAPFSVTNSANYTTGSITLPAGTYVVRAERDYGGNVGVSRSFTVNNLSVNTVSGGGTATFANTSTNTNALAAANTYINNFRKGQANVAVTGPGIIPLLGGTPVHVDLRRHAFNFGTAVAGFNGSTFLQNNPPVGSDNYNYQQAIKQNFNAVVPENAGKWASNSFGTTPTTSFDISYDNTILNFAQANGMRARMHNLIWGNQQPTWVNNILASDPTTLRNTYIPHRIGYYVGDATDGNPNDDPAKKYVELDVYNESYHTGSNNPNPANYWNAYGAAGVAGIYNDVAAAAASVGANVKLFTNEYNVLADGTDQYANWYRNNIEAIRSAGGAVNGVGIQYYANGETATGNAAHNPARIQQVLQNLSVQGISLALTEFGVKPTGSQAHAAQVLSDTVPLLFGTPNATGFFMWGFWHEQMWLEGTGSSAFYNDDWTPTPVLTAWQNLMSQWDTDLTAFVDASGTIGFTGFHGDYYLRGQTSGAYDVTLTKGMSSYAVNMAAPPTWSLWNAANSGNWSAGGNWTTGGVASAAGQTAYFSPAGASRTVNVDSPRTLGMLAFNSGAAYAINGSGAITLAGFNNASGHRTAIYVAAGSHSINAPLLFADDTTVTVASAADVLTVSNLQPSAVSITKRGSGTLVANNVRAAGLHVDQGRVRLLASGGTSNIADLTIAAGASLDLTNNALVTSTAAGSATAGVYSGVQGDVQRAYNFGAWDQPGLTTSMPDAGPAVGVTTIGVATAERILFLAPTETGTFSGQPVTGASTIAMYTYAGDLNFDGIVDATDYGVIDNWIQFAGVDGYANGDFNYDGVIDAGDYGIIDNTIQLQGPPIPPSPSQPSVIAVPEPVACGLALLATCFGARRRRRRHRAR